MEPLKDCNPGSVKDQIVKDVTANWMERGVTIDQLHTLKVLLAGAIDIIVKNRR